jgi:hypothetical protein
MEEHVKKIILLSIFLLSFSLAGAQMMEAAEGTESPQVHKAHVRAKHHARAKIKKGHKRAKHKVAAVNQHA